MRVIGQLLCRSGLHRWKYTDVRDGDYVITWFWCQRDNCPSYHAARRANVERLPLPRKRPTAGVSSDEP